MLLCYDYYIGSIDEKKDIIFATKLKLFSIGAINLPKTIQSMKTTDVEIMDTSGKIGILELNFGEQNTKKKTIGNRYEPKVALEDKVYLETYYSHKPWSVTMDETPAKVKAHEL
jgi:hypothetical protein